MKPQRFGIVTAALCGTAMLGIWVGNWPGFVSAAVENTGALAIDGQRALSLPPEVELTGALASTGAVSASLCQADAAMAVEIVPGTASCPTMSSREPESIETALPEIRPMQLATASAPDLAPDQGSESVSSMDRAEECALSDICIDRYLWTLYERTPKQDTNKVHERRKVTIKKKGKTRTVTRTFTRLVDADFTWKDPKAAEKAGMPLMEYVLGGMDRAFKLKLFRALRAADEAGLSPGITSGFRDDYRQSIASGLKAASDRSYHGGSFRGGYGHGLAADVVSVSGTTKAERWISTERLWNWIDARGKDFGIGRPYLDRDPPHLAPIDGKEYADHHGGTRVRHAASAKRSRVAVRESSGPSKTSKRSKMAALHRS